MNYSIEELLCIFETESQDKRAPETIERVKRDIRMICKDMYIQNLSQFTTEIVIAWGNGRLVGLFGRQALMRTSLSACHSSIRSFLTVLEEQHIVHQVNRRKLIYCTKYKKRKPLRVDDIAAILQVIDDKEVSVLVNLLFHTGMRISEAIKLRAENIGRQNEIWVSGKSKNDRAVFLYDRLRQEMRGLHNDEGYYFRDHRHPDRQMNRKMAYYLLTKYYKLAGYPGYSPHCERHGHITELLSRGANLALVSKDAGHANIETTQIYTHLQTDDTRRMIDAYMPTMPSFS